MVPFGGFAEEVLLPANTCFPKPPGMNFDLAASFLMTYGTSYHALKDRAQLKAGETLLVLGAAGGVGLAAVELGNLMGARVIAAASSDEKLALCKEYGAAEGINYASEDLRARLKEFTGGQGVDVVYDPVGGSFTEPAFRSTAWNGRHLVVGFAAGDIPKIPLNLPLLKGSQIVGVFWGRFAMSFPKENMARSMAKRVSSRTKIGNDSIELRTLIDRLFACEQPNYTASGTPTFIILGLEKIEGFFNK